MNILSITYVDFFQIHVSHQRRVTTPQKNQRQLPPSNTNHNTQPLKPKKNNGTMIPPTRRPPAAAIFKVSDIAVHRAIEDCLHYTVMLFFYVQLTLSLFYWLLFFRKMRALGRYIKILVVPGNYPSHFRHLKEYPTVTAIYPSPESIIRHFSDT